MSKQLKRILLIHWHFYAHQMIELDSINFLTGKTGAGKTTIIDAIQVILLGDTNARRFFNKAANEKSERTLEGYLSGEYGEDGDHSNRSLRKGRYTSYIACEFYDDRDKRYFTIGAAFDSYEVGKWTHQWFIFRDRLPDDHFIKDNLIPMDIQELRAWLRKDQSRFKPQLPASNQQYQNQLTAVLGGLRKNYFSLFRRAVAFTPIQDITRFITDYICDADRSIDIHELKENLRHYRRLEQQAAQIKAQVDHLKMETDLYQEWQGEAANFRLFTYLVSRGELAAAAEKLTASQKALQQANSSHQDVVADLKNLQNETNTLSDKLRGLEEERYSSDIYQKLESLQSAIKQTENDYAVLHAQIDAATLHVRQKATLLTAAADQALAYCLDADQIIATAVPQDQTDNQLAELYEPLQRSAQQLSEPARRLQVAADPLVGREDPLAAPALKTTMTLLAQAEKDFIRAAADGRRLLVDQHKHTEAILTKEKINLTELRRGIKQFPNPGLKPLQSMIKNELEHKYGQQVPVWIVADELEITDADWTDALEGYLHTQKFYLLVEPRYFDDALQVYDRQKKQHQLYDIGLIDIEKLAASCPVSQPGSLAEKVSTKNPLIRQFVDYVLGDVICCQTVSEIREHRRAITASCMLYQNYVARQLNPNRFRDRYIGKSAILAQIEALQTKILHLDQYQTAEQNALSQISDWADLDMLSDYEVKMLTEMIARQDELAEMQKKIADQKHEVEQLDLAWLERLIEMISQIKKTISTREQERNDLLKKLYKLEAQIETIETSEIPAIEKQIAALTADLEQRFESSWREKTAEPRFLREYEQRSNGDAVRNAFYSPQNRSENQMRLKWERVQEARADFNRIYQASASVTAEHNREFEKRLNRLEQEKLPQYLEQIQSAQKMAYEQFESDFLSKLKESIDDVTKTIRELNRTLKDRNWGNERFQFVIEPDPNYRRFYDMIMDDLLMQGYSITYAAFRDKHGDTVDELFRQILSIDEDAGADQRSDLERNIQAFCNYRTYLRFDLHTIDENNDVQRLSKTLRKKSGGETQTPYYIAMLAAFAQLYHIGDRNRSCMQLIIFDEAFSKMDGERIRESIELLRRIGFQCIISAPPDKIADIAPLVERNICVLKHQRHSFLAYFDKQMIRQIEDELDVDSDDLRIAEDDDVSPYNLE